ncbi:MAG: radical SAM family heme chaperone HemW, partial [Luminiphilus sp.]|nr:radical SAM family heme chaperone HemW [Luminiphilus sp.]
MIDPQAVPLSLYIHLPWCTCKCPYCDFNSHEGFTESLQQPYIDSLLADLDSQQAWWRDRPIESIFIGGGTPSLFEGRWLGTLLEGVSNRATLSRHVEITLESNPGSAESSRFAEYRAAGVNRLSIGVQSFDDRALHALGRIHSGDEARRALDMVATAGFQRWNIDLMHGLPGQDAQSGAADLTEAVGRSAGHISWYQLTIERNTRFWSAPPALPSESELESIQQAGEAILADAGLDQYEVSAFSREGEESRHNMNYWRFGDYIGLGAGAHGKISMPDGTIIRTQRTRTPVDYLAVTTSSPLSPPPGVAISPADKITEFAMTTLRLRSGVPLSHFTQTTGATVEQLTAAAKTAVSRGWLEAP